MQVEVYPDAQGAGRAAARMVARLVQVQPSAVVGLASGHTMIPVFGELVRLHHEEGISFQKATTINLDEYVGVGPGHHDSFHDFMRKRLSAQIDLRPEAFHLPNGMSADLEAECARYERLIRDLGGIDVQLLGLGRNGHVAFNEPGSDPGSRTRVVELAPETRDVNAGDFRELATTPARALTLGLANILEARRIILVVTGWEKAPILDRVLATPATVALPATFLHRHPEVTLIADLEAMEAYFARVGGESLSFRLPPPRG